MTRTRSPHSSSRESSCRSRPLLGILGPIALITGAGWLAYIHVLGPRDWWRYGLGIVAIAGGLLSAMASILMDWELARRKRKGEIRRSPSRGTGRHKS